MKNDVISAYGLEHAKKLGFEVPHFCSVRLLVLAHDVVELHAICAEDGERIPLGFVRERSSTLRLHGFRAVELVSKSTISAKVSVHEYQEEEPRTDEAFVAVPLENISPLLRLRDEQRRRLRFALDMGGDDYGPGYEIAEDDDPNLEDPEWFERRRERPQGSSEPASDDPPDAQPEGEPEGSTDTAR